MFGSRSRRRILFFFRWSVIVRRDRGVVNPRAGVSVSFIGLLRPSGPLRLNEIDRIMNRLRVVERRHSAFETLPVNLRAVARFRRQRCFSHLAEVVHGEAEPGQHFLVRNGLVVFEPLLGFRRDGLGSSICSMQSNNRVRNASIFPRSSATVNEAYCASSRFRAAAEICPDSINRRHGVFGSLYYGRLKKVLCRRYPFAGIPPLCAHASTDSRTLPKLDQGRQHFLGLGRDQNLAVQPQSLPRFI